MGCIQSPERLIVNTMKKADDPEKIRELLRLTESYLITQGKLKRAIPEEDATFLTAAIFYQRAATVVYLGTFIDITTNDLAIALWTRNDEIVSRVIDIMTVQGLRQCKEFYRNSIVNHAISTFASQRTRELLANVFHD